MQKAMQLMQQRDYEEAITLLDPVSGSSFSAAYYFYDAHCQTAKRDQFIKRSRDAADKGNPFISYFLARALIDTLFMIDKPRERKFQAASIERYLLNASRSGIAIASQKLGHIYFYGFESAFERPRQVQRNVRGLCC